MIKQVSVMKRNPQLTMDEFRARYECHHAKFGEQLFANAARFVRRYVEPIRNPLTGEFEELDFDVIMEIWWHSREDQEQAMAALPGSPLLGAIVESGATLFATANNPAFTVIECDSDVAGRAWPL